MPLLCHHHYNRRHTYEKPVSRHLLQCQSLADAFCSYPPRENRKHNAISDFARSRCSSSDKNGDGPCVFSSKWKFPRYGLRVFFIPFRSFKERSFPALLRLLFCTWGKARPCTNGLFALAYGQGFHCIMKCASNLKSSFPDQGYISL